MLVTFQKQPTRSSCGQTSVAMAVGVPVEKVIAVVGHATYTRHTCRAAALEKFGWKSGQPVAFKGLSKMPAMALVRIGWRRRSRRSADGFAKSGFRRTGHCVLWANGKFYDPTYGEMVDENAWKHMGGAVVEYVAISKAVVEAPKSVVEAAFEALPETLTCPRCSCTKHKAEFGVRVVKKDAQGNPLKAIRQSYCRSCR